MAAKLIQADAVASLEAIIPRLENPPISFTMGSEKPILAIGCCLALTENERVFLLKFFKESTGA